MEALKGSVWQRGALSMLESYYESLVVNKDYSEEAAEGHRWTGNAGHYSLFVKAVSSLRISKPSL